MGLTYTICKISLPHFQLEVLIMPIYKFIYLFISLDVNIQLKKPFVKFIVFALKNILSLEFHHITQSSYSSKYINSSMHASVIAYKGNKWKIVVIY